ncbi:MAG TPA: DUF1581 domain-containing protein, partial [Planctomycetaceae bacterium]|nr:DUF1581 domain-containing protein [Planctomycetaceae bacterium]
ADAARDVERAKAFLQRIQMAQGQGAELEPSLKQFISERKAAWAKPVGERESRLRATVEDVLIATAALKDRNLHRLGVEFAKGIEQHSIAANIGTLLPQVRRELGAALMKRVPNSEAEPSSDPGLKHWVSGSLTRPQETTGLQPPAWWLAHEGIVSHVSGTGQDYLFFAVPLTGKFEFSCECWAAYWGESNTGYGGLVCDALHGSQRPMLWPAGGPEQRGTHKPQERWDDWNRIRIAVDTERGEASWFVNDHLLIADRDIGPTSPWVSLFAYGVCQTAIRNPRISGEPVIPREVTLSHSDRLDGWVSSFFNESQPPRRQTPPNVNPLVNKVRRAREETDNAFDWSSRDGQIRGRRVTVAADAEQSTQPSRLYYQRPLRNGETVRYEFFYDSDANQLVHPTLGRLAMLLETDGVQLQRLSVSSTGEPEGVSPRTT